MRNLSKLKMVSGQETAREVNTGKLTQRGADLLRLVGLRVKSPCLWASVFSVTAA